MAKPDKTTKGKPEWAGQGKPPHAGKPVGVGGGKGRLKVKQSVEVAIVDGVFKVENRNDVAPGQNGEALYGTKDEALAAVSALLDGLLATPPV